MTYRPFLALLVGAVGLRALLLATYFPAVMQLADSPRFARATPGQTALFDDYWMPAGYPAFLKVLRVPSDQVWFTIAAQHLFGVLLGVVIYLISLRLQAPRWLACVAAGVVLLSGDVLYLEHVIMADWLLLVFSVLAASAVAVGLVPRLAIPVVALAGFLAGAAAVTRSVGLAVLAGVVLSALAAPGLRWPQRLSAGGAALAGGAVALLLYVGAYEVKDGRYLGLSDMRGWNLYSRVAPFSDCTRFSPPAGTGGLCDPTPPAFRPGPFYYSWIATSVSRRHFVETPTTDDRLFRFAFTAIVHQPLDYAAAVVTDLGRYEEPSLGRDRAYGGQGRDLIWFGWRDRRSEVMVSRGLAPKYDGTKVRVSGKEFFGAYQNIARVDRAVLLAAFVLALAGAAIGRGPSRVGSIAFGLVAVGLFVAPTMSLSYDFRYGIPPAIVMAIGGIFGGLSLWTRSRAAARRPRPPTSASAGSGG